MKVFFFVMKVLKIAIQHILSKLFALYTAAMLNFELCNRLLRFFPYEG